MEPPRSVWTVAVVYVTAVAGILVLSSLAVVLVVSVYPDVPEEVVLRGAPALVAGSLAAAAALILTVALVVRPFDPGRLRLRPGWETGSALLVMVIGMLALGQGLDSLTALLGLGDAGTLPVIRQALQRAVGPQLFLVVLSVGVVAPAAEEVFFRGYMQTELGRHWSPWTAAGVTSLAFGVLHVDPTGVHMVLAVFLGLYLAFVVELTGSALPAIVCHVVNNIVFTLHAALGGPAPAPGTHGWLVVGGAVVFVACVAWLRRATPRGGA